MAARQPSTTHNHGDFTLKYLGGSVNVIGINLTFKK